MAITDIVVSGKIYQDDGDAVNGATVALLETGTSTQEASTTSDSNGAWSFTETSLDTTYDIKITSGSSVRYILWSDEITAKGVDTASLKVRGTEGAVAPIYFFADQADDAGDAWRIQASASDTLAIGSDKASAGTIIDYLTITNGANAAASLTTILGKLTVGVDDTGADVKFFGATTNTYMLWDESTDDLVLTLGAELYFYDAGGGEHIKSDGTDMTIYAGTDLNLTAGTDINVPANVGLTFGNDAEKIEGDGTDLTISGNNINLTATADVVIPADVGITFGSGEKIEGDSTDLTITSGADINLTATSDVNIPANVGITFGDDAEKIEGDGTDLTISGNNINLTAVADVNIPSGVGITFATTEKIESDGTDLSITVGSNGDINIPANIGMTFGDDGEKIEGDGTDLTISGNIINLSGAVTATGILKTDDTTEATSTTDGSLQTDGGLSVAKDAVFGDDVKLLSDSAVLAFGADGDATLTHTNDAGITLNSTNKLMFNDASQFIQGSSATVISIGATDEIDLTATAVDLNGTLDVSGNAQFSGTITIGADDTGKDVKFFGATAGSYMLWDESDDALELTDSSPIRIGDGTDMVLYHDGTDSYITNAIGTLKLATETSGVPISIGHSTSEVTVNDNLTVTGYIDLSNAGDIRNVGASGNDWTGTAFSHDGGATFNASNGNYDFRIESVNNGNMFKLDASVDMVGIGMPPSDHGYAAGIALAGGHTYTSGTNVASILVYNSVALTIDGYTATRAGAVDIYEPNIVLANSGAVTHAYTLRVRAPNEGTNNYSLWVDDGMALFDEGCNIGGTSTNNKIDDASGGSGSTTLYVGNESITTSSDARLKTDIRPTEIDALALLDQMDVVDFGWDDPSDVTEYGRNYRGTYTGMVAQDTVKLAPWIINDQGGGRDCDACMAGRECDQHGMFHVEYQHLVPTLVKAIQELKQELAEVRNGN